MSAPVLLVPHCTASPGPVLVCAACGARGVVGFLVLLAPDLCLCVYSLWGAGRGGVPCVLLPSWERRGWGSRTMGGGGYDVWGAGGMTRTKVGMLWQGECNVSAVSSPPQRSSRHSATWWHAARLQAPQSYRTAPKQAVALATTTLYSPQPPRGCSTDHILSYCFRTTAALYYMTASCTTAINPSSSKGVQELLPIPPTVIRPGLGACNRCLWEALL